MHPTEFSKTLFPGQDYNNARYEDFKKVNNYLTNEFSILEQPRMPWEDVRFLSDRVLYITVAILTVLLADSHDANWPRSTRHYSGKLFTMFLERSKYAYL